MRLFAAVFLVSAFLAGPVAAQAESAPADMKPGDPCVVTKKKATIGGAEIAYSVTAGWMPLKTDGGEKEADIFFMAYVKDGVSSVHERPLIFSFNGGPGSSSVWLHLGALGPKRVKMQDDGGMPAPPYELVDNPESWLDIADIVFIDPVGTGYSRPAKPELGRKFWGLTGDIESVGEFIRLYLVRYERWRSPLFLAGESYGTTRAAGLAGYLVERSGIAFNGIVLVSSILNFQTARFAQGNDLPYPLFLPTYAATAWKKKKLAPDLQEKPLREVLDGAEAYAAGEYTRLLAKGSALADEEKKSMVAQTARWTGLDPAFVERANMRIEIQRFCKELLRDRGRTVGRLDTRFEGVEPSGNEATPEFDPSMAAIVPPYTATFNDYVRRDLLVRTDMRYWILGGGIGEWDWGRKGNEAADTSESLRQAFAKNPAMRVFIASGYYDLATPYFATKYTLSHMGLDRAQRARVMTAEYEAGHMMYIDVQELKKLRADVGRFIGLATKGS